jgi:hypothetical protein
MKMREVALTSLVLTVSATPPAGSATAPEVADPHTAGEAPEAQLVVVL